MGQIFMLSYQILNHLPSLPWLNKQLSLPLLNTSLLIGQENLHCYTPLLIGAMSTHSSPEQQESPESDMLAHVGAWLWIDMATSIPSTWATPTQPLSLVWVAPITCVPCQKRKIEEGLALSTAKTSFKDDRSLRIHGCSLGHNETEMFLLDFDDAALNIGGETAPLRRSPTRTTSNLNYC